MLPLVLFAGAAAALYGWLRAGSRRVEREVGARLVAGGAGMVPGAEPIELADGSEDRAVLVLHGFGDTPQSLRYLAEHLHRAGYAVRAPLLPGHGRTLRDFAASGGDAWIDHARDEWARLRERYPGAYLVGVSMGGALAALLAGDPAVPPPPALALVAPYVSMPRTLRRLARAHRLWGPLAGYLSSAGGPRSIHDPEELRRSLNYGAVTARLLFELLGVMERAAAALPRITTPTLVIQSREDNRIPPDAAEREFARLGAPEKRLVWVEGCGHVVTVDYGRERAFGLVEAWLEGHAAKDGARCEARDARSAQ
ncbi:MAG TPA: alpha/beta fold hydrolase [Gemmatimonadaceae bacterium]|nr:alpha/beta fold hydrolase [Gemmatimonadaceae bacterium]